MSEDTLLVIIFLSAVVGLPVLFGIGCGISRVFEFIAGRIEQRDESKNRELAKQLSVERAEALKLRALQIEHGLPVTPLEILDGDSS